MLLRDMTTEDILNENPNLTYVKTDKNGTRYFTDSKCGRCNGTGTYCWGAVINGVPQYAGVCFECNGSGISPKEIKVFTKEHEDKLADQRAARYKKKMHAKQQSFVDHLSESMLQLGFGLEDDEYVTYRLKGDTYSIKDELKAKGCKFCKELGWHSAIKPEGYDSQRMFATDLLIVDKSLCLISYKNQEAIKDLFDKEEKPVSEWQGAVGEIIEIDARVDKYYVFDNGVYTTALYLLSDEKGNVYKWSTAKCLEEGKHYHLKGKVKEHAEYKDVKQTVITRCVVNEI